MEKGKCSWAFGETFAVRKEWDLQSQSWESVQYTDWSMTKEKNKEMPVDISKYTK